ncbi:hypothetical protein D9M70_512940 [compost metagenome]
MTGFDRKLPQPVARVGNQRRSGVGNERHRSPFGECCKQPGSGFVGIVLVIGVGPVHDAIAVEQHARNPRVLAGEHVGAGKRFQCAQRDIAEIADRGRHQIERRIERPGRNADIVQAIAALSLPARCFRSLLLFHL